MAWCADIVPKERYILSMIRKSPFVIAFCLNVLFFLLYLFLGQVKHGSLDDYFMSSVLTGAYGGEYDVHMYFVNAAYGYFLKPFYWLFPKVGWYFIFELIGTFAAFTLCRPLFKTYASYTRACEIYRNGCIQRLQCYMWSHIACIIAVPRIFCILWLCQFVSGTDVGSCDNRK